MLGKIIIEKLVKLLINIPYIFAQSLNIANLLHSVLWVFGSTFVLIQTFFYALLSAF